MKKLLLFLCLSITTITALAMDDRNYEPTYQKKIEWCHQCKQKKSELSYCTHFNCKKKYCSVCLSSHYNIAYEQINKDEWKCPSCKNECNCAYCKRKRDPNRKRSNHRKKQKCKKNKKDDITQEETQENSNSSDTEFDIDKTVSELKLNDGYVFSFFIKDYQYIVGFVKEGVFKTIVDSYEISAPTLRKLIKVIKIIIKNEYRSSFFN